MIAASYDDMVFSEVDIGHGVNIVADKLNSQFSNGVVVVTVVPGGILFTADLVRKLDFDIAMDYISCPHTPGERQNNSNIVFHNNVGIDGKDVILIDDAIESGGTMKRLAAHLYEHYYPKSLSIATLFVKPSRIDIPVKQFYAYEMSSDDLLVGYGLPWEHKYRNTPFISKLNPLNN